MLRARKLRRPPPQGVPGALHCHGRFTGSRMHRDVVRDGKIGQSGTVSLMRFGRDAPFRWAARMGDRIRRDREARCACVGYASGHGETTTWIGRDEPQSQARARLGYHHGARRHGPYLSHRLRWWQRSEVRLDDSAAGDTRGREHAGNTRNAGDGRNRGYRWDRRNGRNRRYRWNRWWRWNARDSV